MQDAANGASKASLQHQRLSDQGFGFMTTALDIENMGSQHDNDVRDNILANYQMGVQSFKAALKLQFTRVEERCKAEQTNAKILRSIAHSEARIALLSRAAAIQPTTPAIPVKAPAKKLVSTRSLASVIPPRTSASPSSASSKQPNKTAAAAAPLAKPIKSKTDSALCQKILDDILIEKPNVTWDDIVGLEKAKQALREIVILPAQRPDVFTGLRSPPRGILLFGPPGTGKTMLAKAVARESAAQFFSISASSLTSKYVGEGEKMVRALFEMARQLSPSIIFIDEIDSILTERSDGEHEASRRLKTEFLLQFDGIGTDDDRVIVMGATNRPGDLDEAALRRMVKRIYIPLPEASTRKAFISNVMKDQRCVISSRELSSLVTLSDGYSGSDLKALAREASLGPVRNIDILNIDAKDIRPVTAQDFIDAMAVIRPSVSKSSLGSFETWNASFGTRG